MKMIEILKIVGIFIIFFYVPKVLMKIIPTKKLNNRNETIFLVILNVIRYIALIFTIIIIVSLLEINETTLLATSSFLGLVFGIGAQKIVQDMISGFFIIFEDHLRVQDFVSINESMGEIVNIGLKTITIKTWEGEYHAISNGDIKKIINYSKYDSLAIVDVLITYDNDIEYVNKIITQYIDEFDNNFPYIKGKPIYLGVQQSNDLNLTIRVIANTVSYEHFQVKRWILADMVSLFKAKGVKMAILNLEKK